jgi:hypothetical protein
LLPNTLLMLVNALWSLPILAIVRSNQALVPELALVLFGMRELVISLLMQVLTMLGELWVYPLALTGTGFLRKQSCNNFFDKLVRRNFHVSPLVSYLYRWNLLLPPLPPTTYLVQPQAVEYWRCASKNLPPCFPFLLRKDRAAEAWLVEQGWQTGSHLFVYMCGIVPI